MNRADVERLADQLDASSPGEILAWAVARFPRVGFATGFGLEGCVLVDLIARHRLKVDVFTLDTGLLFPQTYELWRRLERRYDLTIRAALPQRTVAEQASEFGDRLWERDPERCCGMRKVAPLTAVLAGFDAWVTGIRRDQTRERSAVRVVEWDDNFRLVKVNPLAEWSEQEVWSYVRENDVPFNPLHGLGYRSIGCAPCTTPVLRGEGSRAGRWRGREKKECGIHARFAIRTAVRNENDGERAGNVDVR